MIGDLGPQAIQMSERDAANDEWEQLAVQFLEKIRGIRPHGGHHAKDIEIRGKMSVLLVLYKLERGASAGELAERCDVTTARMAQTLNRLESDGLIERSVGIKDRRKTIVQLTSHGRAVVYEHRKHVMQYTVSILKGLGTEDAHELVRLLDKTSAIMHELHDKECAQSKAQNEQDDQS